LSMSKEFKQERAELKQKLDEAINHNALIEGDFNLLRKQLGTDDEDNASEMKRISDNKSNFATTAYRMFNIQRSDRVSNERIL
jgi:regulator of replication initiation timing